jgi:hypothetical protein
MIRDVMNRYTKYWDKVEKEQEWFDYSTIRGASDPIRKPSHYAEGRIYEPWKVIMDWDLNYLAGSAVKYISRYERKGTPEQDLRKAIRFLEMELEHRANNSRLG